jgi:hypothetical protein
VRQQPYGLTHAGHLVGLQVVENDGVAGLQHRNQGIGEVAADAFAVRGSIEQGGGNQTRGAQGGGDGGRLVVPVGHRDLAALAAWGSAVAAGHLCVGRGLIEKDEPVRVEVGLGLEPCLACGSYVLAFLLSGVERPFLPVIRWRWKKRDRPLVLVCTPGSARRSRHSRRNIGGCASQTDRIRSACASIRCEVRSPPDSLGAT